MLATVPLMLMLLGGALPADTPLSSVSERGACPAETEQGRRVALHFATWERHTQTRESYGMDRLTEEEVRLLVDETDRAVCEQIAIAVQRSHANATSEYLSVYYAAGDHYFAVLSLKPRTPPPAPAGSVNVSLGRWVPLIVLDRDFNIVGSVAM